MGRTSLSRLGGADQCLDIAYDGHRDGQRLLEVRGAGNDDGMRTVHLYFPHYQLALQDWDKALIILVGGYGGFFVDEEDKRNVNSGSSVCGDAAALCLFAPWSYSYREDERTTRVTEGTSFATPQVAAALDTVWAVWPDMDILDLRNLAFDCAENQDPRESETSTERTYSYRNGRSFTSSTNPTWGHGILSLTCLFTPNGGLQNPVTGNAISGGIFGPLAGPVTGASITGVDYTGRDFGYGFARPVARENFALASLAFGSRSNLRPVQASNRHHGVGYAQGAYGGRLWQSGALSVDLTAAGASGGYGGGALGAAVAWQVRNLTLRGGIAAQPEGVGSLTGSRAFRAPSTVSVAMTAAYAAALPRGFSAHLQADHWRTLATRARSLWEGAAVRESRLTAALVKRAGAHEFALQGFWRSGLSGSLAVNGRSWTLTPKVRIRPVADLAPLFVGLERGVGRNGCTDNSAGIARRERMRRIEQAALDIRTRGSLHALQLSHRHLLRLSRRSALPRLPAALLPGLRRPRLGSSTRCSPPRIAPTGSPIRRSGGRPSCRCGRSRSTARARRGCSGSCSLSG